MIWVKFPPGTGHKGNLGGPEIKSRQSAIRGFKGHYMRHVLWPFWRMGHYNGPDCRRYDGSPTVAVGWGILQNMGVRPGIFRELSGKKIKKFPKIFPAIFFSKKIPENPDKIKNFPEFFCYGFFRKKFYGEIREIKKNIQTRIFFPYLKKNPTTWQNQALFQKYD
jgi:hypothetical protein